MKTSNIIALSKERHDLPISLTKGVLNLYNVENVEDITDEIKNKINKTLNDLYNGSRTTDYSSITKEYALYYLPLNMYKVWRPLIDLLEKNQIKSDCSYLELGSGPGSTAFGIFEFYRHLALENNNISFNIYYSLVEKEKEFIKIFNSLFEFYKKEIPNNLNIKIKAFNNDVTYFLNENKEKFDYIVESNLLNPNEKIENFSYQFFSKKICNLLNKNASIILIEPVKENLSAQLKTLKFEMTKCGLNIYSPCSCANGPCSQYAIATNDIQSINLINKLYEYNIVKRNSYKPKHYFEYVVLRNDNLYNKKIEQGPIKLCDLKNYIGQTISFKAFIISFVEKDNNYLLKLCDGSFNEKTNVCLIVNKSLFKERLNDSSLGRGGIAIVKNAYVISETQINAVLSTSLKLER